MKWSDIYYLQETKRPVGIIASTGTRNSRPRSTGINRSRSNTDYVNPYKSLCPKRGNKSTNNGNLAYRLRVAELTLINVPIYF